MRDIEFRGISKETDTPDYGKWVYGGYIFRSEPSIFVVSEDKGVGWSELVIPETVGEFTGLSAKKSYRGTKPDDLWIFEGDIIKADLDFEKDGRAGWIMQVCFHKGMFIGYTGKELNNYNWRELIGYHNIEVIGNIHDNPELLEAP